jgi:hypothetical protein
MPLPSPLITSSPERLGGTPVFAGTRVPTRPPRGGRPAGRLPGGVPSVTREHAVAVLELAERVLAAHANAA